MSSNKNKGKLSRQITGIVVISAAIAIFFFSFLYITSSSLVIKYQEAKGIIPTEDTLYTTDTWLFGLSLAAAAIVFTVLFLVLMGQKLAYLRRIIEGIEALRTHRMNHTIPLKGNNEFTELARSINFLSETERALAQQEKQLQQDRETFIRAMSHDIRTPLTSILSYTQYVKDASDLPAEQMDAYVELVEKKAEQIKELTDRLLDISRKVPDEIPDGKLLMEQLAEEWAAELENDFKVILHYEDCPAFTGRYDVGELQRIFDNLASNVKKYADPSQPVSLALYEERTQHSENKSAQQKQTESSSPGQNAFLVIQQTNGINPSLDDVESHGIGLQNIRRIAEGYGGRVEVEPMMETADLLAEAPCDLSREFCIKIWLKINL